MTDLNRCRHFLGLFPDRRPSCAMGRDVRAWAMRCNGGSNFGIGLRLPCTKQATDAEKPLFDCPEIDRKTNEEVEAQRAEMRAVMSRLISAMPALNDLRQTMIEAGQSSRTADCPLCGEAGTLSVSVAIGANNHMRAQCSKCGEGFIE